MTHVVAFSFIAGGFVALLRVKKTVTTSLLRGDEKFPVVGGASNEQILHGTRNLRLCSCLIARPNLVVNFPVPDGAYFALPKCGAVGGSGQL